MTNQLPHYEFGGPIGALMTMIALPIVIIFLYDNCNSDYCMHAADVTTLRIPKVDFQELVSGDAVLVILSWFGFQVLLERILPGKKVEGVLLPPGGSKKRLTYVMSGHLQFWLGCAASMFSIILSIYFYASSFIGGKQLAHGGTTGNEFCELRPGLIGWVVINAAMMLKQYQLQGTVSPSMVMVNILQCLYVWDALYQEQAILTTMDITSDGLGFMLTFGDLAWVPFTYTLQCRYLVDRDPDFSVFTAGVLTVLCLCGYTIFRCANSEKDAFRRDPKHPSVSHLKTMETNRPERKLLISGWWGLARKINYTGDWIMGLSWSLFTGFGTLLTYFYPIYFAILLIHRAGRDNEMCSAKYGNTVWSQYKKHVPSLFIPGII